MIDRWLRTAGSAALAGLLALPLAAHADDDAFTVSGVHEDVTAASALAARDRALAEGQQKAFGILMSRLAPGKAPHESDAAITDFVAGFEVGHERTSTVRYVADYTFHFNPAAIRHLLQDSSVPTVAARAKPVIVLPVLTSTGHSVLWDDPNPWRDAWANRAGGQDQFPVVIPEGDLADVSAIDAPQALAGDAKALHAISARYQNDDVMVAQAKLSSAPRGIDITMARFSPSHPGVAQTVSVTTTATAGESDGHLLNRAVADTMSRADQSWRAATSINPNTGGTMKVSLQSGSLADWITVRGRLRDIPAVRAADLISFDRNRIRVAIHYQGDESQLRAALSAHDLALTGSDPDVTLVLAPKDATAPPAETAPAEPAADTIPAAIPPPPPPDAAGRPPDGDAMPRVDQQP